MSLKRILLLCASLSLSTVYAQTGNDTVKTASKTFRQNVHGYVTDAESKQPIAGVVVILQSNTTINAMTDDKGYYNIENVPIGRQSFQYRIAGYEPYTATEVPVISGKELELNASLSEQVQKLKEVTISANKDRARPINEFATVSARSFSVEETRRYASSFADPARMVMNFPGVSNSGDGQNNIVVRGNSPKGILWRLEGIEIPNPNHFTSIGSTGGAISMLNANTLGNSDFYTGAFAPEIGNATAGVFDLNLRNGNTERREHTVQVGALGVELATEGPFQKGKKASYLVNYRYSTLALLERFVKLGGVVPNYQDGSFKINMPTEKAGTFTVFGLGGYNVAKKDPVNDSSKWDDEHPNIIYDSRNYMGVAGVSHQYFTGKDAYIKTVVSGSLEHSAQTADTLNPTDAYRKIPVENTFINNTALRLSVLYNDKINASNTLRTGVVVQQLGYDLNYKYYDFGQKQWKSALASNGNTQFYQAYIQWKSRLTQHLTLVGGVHGSYLALNGKYAIEPRASLSYGLKKSKFTLAAGMHSKPEHLSTYMYTGGTPGMPATYSNKDLDLVRAVHTVAGYEVVLPWKLRMKIEAYYQYLYNIPVEKDTASGFSILNAEDSYMLLSLKKQMMSDGTGRNYGVDISFERPFMDNYYVLATGSVFRSTYTDYAGHEYSTRYNRGYQGNIIGGKEFKLNVSGNRLIGLNGKVLFSGGMRESEIDLNRSRLNGTTEIVPGQYFTQHTKAYFRADAGVYYKFNRKRATHTLQLDVQNFTNRQNYYFSYFDSKSGNVKTVNQLGILPNISYRIDFH